MPTARRLRRTCSRPRRSAGTRILSDARRVCRCRNQRLSFRKRDSINHDTMHEMRRINASYAGPAVILIRILVGWVFLSEGIQKFIYPAALGAGRFEKIGIPAPHIMGAFVGGVEIVCGLLLLVGLATRLATIPLLISMSVAIISTKVPILLGHGFGPFSLPKLSGHGFWSMSHEGRTDFSMFLGLIFLLIVGGGRWSWDARLFAHKPGEAVNR